MLRSVKSPDFLEDVDRQIDWYVNEAGLDYDEAVEIVFRFLDAIDKTVEKLLDQSMIGQSRFKSFPGLEKMRSHPVHKPFQRFRIFYRIETSVLYLERLIEGHRQAAAGRD